MEFGSRHRKVLIIEDEPSIRNVLFVLLAGLGCEGDVAYSGRQGLSMIRQEKFDAVLLDLRCSELEPDKMVSAIKEIRPNLVGRVLVITGEVTDPATMEILERNCLPHMNRDHSKDELWSRLEPLLGFASAHANSKS